MMDYDTIYLSVAMFIIMIACIKELFTIKKGD